MNKFILMAVMALMTVSVPICMAGPTSPLDLTTAGASGTINGALFQQIQPSSTGTGVLQPFLRIGPDDDGIEAGYNSDGGQFAQTHDNPGSNWNHSLLISDLAVVNVSGTDYRQFMLDINQEGNPTARFLSLDTLQIYLEPTGDLTGDPSGFPAGPIYDMDAGSDSWILLDEKLNHGSGSGDMFAFIPDSLFTGSNQFVYLYAEFGANTAANDGFEEWHAIVGESVQPPVVPVPGAMLLGSIGVGIVGWMRARRSL